MNVNLQALNDSLANSMLNYLERYWFMPGHFLLQCAKQSELNPARYIHRVTLGLPGIRVHHIFVCEPVLLA